MRALRQFEIQLAHVKLKYTPAHVETWTSGMFLLSDYSEDQAQEADSSVFGTQFQDFSQIALDVEGVADGDVS